MKSKKWLIPLVVLAFAVAAGAGAAVALTGDGPTDAGDALAEAQGPAIAGCLEAPDGGEGRLSRPDQTVEQDNPGISIGVPIGIFPGDVEPGLDPDPFLPVRDPSLPPISVEPGIAVEEPHPDTSISYPVTDLPKGPRPTPVTSSSTGEALAPIESVEIVIMESFPPQYNLVVVSGLPNGCVSFGDYSVTRDGNTILVEVTNLVPTDPQLACTEIYGMVTTRIALGSDFESGTTYTIVVNDVATTFVAQ